MVQRRTGAVTPRTAYGYLCLPHGAAPDVETRHRWSLMRVAHREGLELRGVFVDRSDEQPYGFAVLGEMLRRGGVHALVLPDLTHVGQVPAVGYLTRAELARHLGVDVLLASDTRSRHECRG